MWWFCKSVCVTNIIIQYVELLNVLYVTTSTYIDKNNAVWRARIIHM